MLEALLPNAQGNVDFAAVLNDRASPTLLQTGIFTESPLIAFRWLKSPGDLRALAGDEGAARHQDRQ